MLWWNLVKTIILLAVIWSVFLFAIPIGISIVEVQLGVQRIPPQMPITQILFPLFTALCAWAALTLAISGRGTPLAFDGPQRLVTRGPYAFVRHPMAIGIIGQGACVGLALGSVPVLIYVGVLAVVWALGVRRREERRLHDRFGADWDRYRAAVSAWRPRLHAYKDIT